MEPKGGTACKPLVYQFFGKSFSEVLNTRIFHMLFRRLIARLRITFMN